MIKVFAAPNAAVVKLAADILEQHEIGFVIRNDRIGSAVGEIPWTEAWPEIWLLDARDEERAHKLLAPFEDPDVGAAEARSWTCPGCGERIEGQFTQCWSCGAAAP